LQVFRNLWHGERDTLLFRRGVISRPDFAQTSGENCTGIVGRYRPLANLAGLNSRRQTGYGCTFFSLVDDIPQVVKVLQGRLGMGVNVIDKSELRQKPAAVVTHAQI
jgi:hypothetical protein